MRRSFISRKQSRRGAGPRPHAGGPLNCYAVHLWTSPLLPVIYVCVGQGTCYSHTKEGNQPEPCPFLSYTLLSHLSFTSKRG
uniref:Uncharacterized protein n=1 Tax=Engystomops pustulosus TaxID=76066 RepID=A0AAV6YJK2_ENGPU|nr:hypothetical protein GDO81_024078 [Engystomops pustulosus]